MTNILEIIMIICTIIYSYLLIYCNRQAFIFGIISSCIMGYILLIDGIFIQSILYFIYMIMYLYSYFNWGRKDAPRISSMTCKACGISAIYILIFTLVIGYIFSAIGEKHPYIDSFSAACSMTAVFLLDKKVIEHAYIFVLANISAIYVCYVTHDYVTILTFLVYMIFNLIRAYTWKKELIKINKKDVSI